MEGDRQFDMRSGGVSTLIAASIPELRIEIRLSEFGFR